MSLPAAFASSGVARAVYKKGLIDQSVWSELSNQYAQKSGNFIDMLIASGTVSTLVLAHCLSEVYGYPLLDLDEINVASLPISLIDPKLLKNWQFVPLSKRGSTLTVGLSDPTDIQLLQQLKFQTQSMIEPVVVEHSKLVTFISRLQRINRNILDKELAQAESVETSAVSDTALMEQLSEVDDVPIVKYIQKLLLDAIAQRASDLHFEPYEKFYRVRYRIDGVLGEVSQPPISTKEKIAARIKILSRLDIAERRVPQDGRMRLVIDEIRFVDFRVSTLPTLFGEKIVIRILDPSSAKVGIESLGYEPEQKQSLLEAIARPHGMVLVTGPTGSGKTVSLYTCLNMLNRPGVNICTAEDPSEINLPGINQVNINDKAGLTFSGVLRAFLRQDPDIIMVGEIRDLETADIAIKAAQTGHLVFSTLHTNDAAATIVRLINMGVAPFNIASSLVMVSAQRLIRKLCVCKDEHEVTPELLIGVGFSKEDVETGWVPFKPVGCDICGGTGYKGRTGIYEVMPIDEDIQRIILSHGSVLEIRESAKSKGVKSLRESALKKVRDGITSLEEILSATQS